MCRENKCENNEKLIADETRPREIKPADIVDDYQ